MVQRPSSGFGSKLEQDASIAPAAASSTIIPVRRTTPLLLDPGNGSPQDIFDLLRSRTQHGQTVETQGYSSTFRHAELQGRQEVGVDRVALTIQALLEVHIRLEPGTLHTGVGQFAERV